MLDRKFITENAGTVQQNCIHRGVQVDVDRLVQIEVERRAQQNEVQDLNTQANANNKRIKQAADSEQREAIIEEGRRLRERKDLAQAACDALDAEAHGIQRLLHHVELGQRLDLFDFESAAKITGHGFYFLKNDAVLLDLSLQRYALDLLIAEGFTPTITPDLARNEILEGVGFIPRGPETQIYSVENSDLSLVATAEITLGGLLSGQTLDAADLPLRFVGMSHCYRTEAGAHGRATRGLFRVHQFTKVEMFTFTLPDQSDAMLGCLRDLECRLFDGLEIPYRVVDTATGDLGGPAYRKFDLEAWMPGRGDGGEYAEVTSTSNCTDYQSRRLGIRYKTKGQKGTNFVHTLNGTAVAISRAIIAVLENHQQEDGSVLLPEALRSYMGKDRIVAKS
jgi:seryl-tRNA synthetase